MKSARALLAPLLVLGRIEAAHAAGATPLPTARLEVQAAPECTSQGDLIARVQARAPRIRFVDDDASMAVRAQFTPVRSGGVAADFVLTGPGASSSSRRLVARSCREAVEAVALIVAVTLDPASVTGTSEATPADTPPASVPNSTSTGQPIDPATQGRDAATKPATGSAAPSADLARGPSAGVANAGSVSPAEAAPARFRIGGYVAGESVLGLAPAVMPGVTVYAIAETDREALWSPAIVLGATHAWSAEIAEWGGTASFTLDAANLDACAVRLRLSVMAARVCGSASFGRLSAQGTDTLNPAGTVGRPFVAIGGSVVVTAELGWIIELWARGAAGTNLVRDSFEFTPNVFHSVDAVTVSGSLGIGARLR